MDQEVPSDDTQGSFDHSKALSERDRAIAKRDEELKVMRFQHEALQAELNKLKGSAQPIGELSAGQTNTSSPNQGQQSSSLDDRMAALEKMISGMATGFFDTQFGTRQLAADEDFVKWAKETRYSPFDPNSPTLEQAFVQARESGDHVLAEQIKNAYYQQNRQVSSAIPNFQAKPTKTAEQKKIDVKISELEGQRKTAMNRHDFKEAKRITDEIIQLRR